MPAAPLNSDLLLSALLRVARLEPDPKAYIQQYHSEALAAVMRGDEFVSSTAFGGQSATSERSLDAQTLLQLYEAALQILDQEEAAEETGLYVGPGSVRHADFSQYPSTLG